MAFVLNCSLESVEFRAMRTGVGRDSKKSWMSLVLEDSDSNHLEISVPQDLQGEVYGLSLQKGDILKVDIRAVARNDGNSYVQLRGVPMLLVDADGVVS